MKKDVDQFWNTSLPDLLHQQNVDPVRGLTAAEAQDRILRYGPNIATDVQRTSLPLQFLQRFRNPLIILLLVASLLSLATGDVAGSGLIIAMVGISVVLDFFQEVRAERTVDALRRSVALKATVRRDGVEATLLAQDLVPGDIILLSPGCLVPADGRLLSCHDLYVNQSLLTGESFPAEKTARDLATASQDINDAANSVFMGTSVISGTGTMVAQGTGKNSHFGGLAGLLAKARPLTAFEQGIRDFGSMILRFVIGMTLFVLLFNLGFHRPPLQSFMFALALAVGLTPELLPMVMTITLSRGARRMAAANVIVKHLPAMHGLGAMDILCTDKTGTLTEANVRLVNSLSTDGVENPRAFLLAYINSTFETGIKSPLDQAIMQYGTPDISTWSKLDEVPFDFERRRVSVLAAKGEQRFLIVKGAPEDIIRLSTQYEGPNGATAPFDDAERAKVLQTFEQLGESGLRVLAVALREVDKTQAKAVITDETSLVFAGFVTFIDPPKESAGAALRQLADLGVGVKIITGDNERVTSHVCTMLGFDVGEILTGTQLTALSGEAFSARVEMTRIFCRVTPQQKSQIILALKARGHVVGFLGDGINDAAALHSADVGLSVESATDVARAAADMILLEKDLSVIHDGILEGRRAVRNTEKYILMGSSSNFGNMFSMALGTIVLPFLPMLPMQILLNNLLYDLSQVAIPFDNVDTVSLSKPIRWDMHRIRKFMWIMGPVSSVFDLITFYVLLRLFPSNEDLFRTGWFVESLMTQCLIVLSIRTPKSLFTSRPHPFLAGTALFVSAVGVALPYTTLGAWFHLQPLPTVFYAFLAVALIAYFSFVEVAKRVFYKPAT